MSNYDKVLSEMNQRALVLMKQHMESSLYRALGNASEYTPRTLHGSTLVVVTPKSIK